MLFSSDPNRDPYGISERLGPETAGEDTAHGFCRLALGGRGHVGVGVQGEPRAEVPQHPGHRFYVHPVLQGQGGKGVAQIMEPNPRACLKNQETCTKSTELQWRQGERRPRRRCPACRIW